MSQFILLSNAYKYNIGHFPGATMQNYTKITKVIVASFLVQVL